MQSKVFSWSRVEKAPAHMEMTLNDFLEDKVFKFAVQNESPQSGRVMLTVFYDKSTKTKPANSKATVLRTQGHTQLEKQMNAVLKPLKDSLIMSTQSFSANTITTIFFHGQ